MGKRKYKPIKNSLMLDISIQDNDMEIWHEKDPLGIALKKLSKHLKEKGMV